MAMMTMPCYASLLLALLVLLSSWSWDNGSSGSTLVDAFSAAPSLGRMATTIGRRNERITVVRQGMADEEGLQSASSSSRRDFFETTLTQTVTAVATLSGISTTTAAVAAIPQPASASLASSSLLSSATAVQNTLQLPPMGLGAWAWGDSLFWGYDSKNDDELRKVFDYAITNSKSSTTLLDTAEIYGFGRSESLIGDFSKPYSADQIQVATKFAALPWRTKAADVVNACEKSLQRLQGRPIDLYQIHFPNGYANEAYWDGLAMAYDKGLVKAVGVSNYGVDAVRACHKALAQRGIPLATNQIQLSLLYRWPLQNGLLQCCNDLNVKVLSYSPLALGMLTGKYSAEKKPSGPRKALYDKLVTTPDYDNLLSVMRDVAASHADQNATPAQVALNWTRRKNTIPIPGARTVAQVQGNYGALAWNLSADEEKILDAAAAKVTTFIQPDASPFAKKDKDTGLVMFDS